MIAIPRPFKTLGNSDALAYTRSPGLLILLSPVMTFSFLLLAYFNVRVILSPLTFFSTLYILCLYKKKFKVIYIVRFIEREC